MDSISWSRGRPHRRSCTFLRRSWSRKVAIDTFLRPHLKNWCWKPFSGMLVLLFLSWRWWYLLFGLLVLRQSILSLLQSATSVIAKCDSFNYYKVRWSVITKCDSFFITKCDRYCKVRRLLQIATEHTRAAVYATYIPGPATIGLQTFTDWLEPIHIPLFYSRQRYHTLQRYSFKEVTREKEKQYVISQYPECFNAVGRFQGEYHIVLEPRLPPVVYPPRRVTFSLKNYIKKELDEKLHQSEDRRRWTHTMAQQPCLPPQAERKFEAPPEHQTSIQPFRLNIMLLPP